MFYPHLSLCRAYFFQAFTDENCNYFAQIENTNMIYLQKVQKCFKILTKIDLPMYDYQE